MSPLYRLGVAVLTGLMALGAQAAVKDLPVKNINGKPFHYYKVPDHETVYSVLYKLGISKEELVSANPAVADGLKAGMILYFPKEDGTPAATAPAAGGTVRHVVERGETIIGIGRKYGLTVAEVMAQNPFLKDGLKAGQTLEITLPEGSVPAPDATAAVAEAPAQELIEMQGYLVKKGETLYSIAATHGITPADIEAANPNLGVLKAGQVLSLPLRKAPDAPATTATTSTTPAETPAATSVSMSQTEPITQTAPTTPAVPAATATPATPAAPAEVSVAVLLPFMLSEETPSKNTQRTTEFYKGFLLAVDSLRNSKTPINITAYDTEGSAVKVSKILQDSAFSRHTAIVAPDDASQLALLAEYGKNNNVPVLNPFLVRDDSYQYNPYMIQGNLPTRQMYTKAVNALAERLERSVPVFLSVKGSQADKAEFVSELKKELDSRSIAYTDIEVDGALTPATLAGLSTDGNYTFIPLSSRQADLNKLLPGLIEWRDASGTPLVRLFGYPEWTTFRGETLTNMHNIGTTLYSRIYADYDDARSEDVDAKFKRWYGTQMESVVPRQGLMGFDAGMFLIPWLQQGRKTYDGVQNGFRLRRADDGAGMYNDMLYFINFRPGGATDKTPL